MPSIRQLKRRIKSAKNISQVTKALEMVSAVKMRKAQETALSGKPYASELKKVLSELTNKVESDSHPFLTPRETISRLLVVVIGSEKGLAGPLVTNLTRKVLHLHQQIQTGTFTDDSGFTSQFSPNVQVSAVSWGKKSQSLIRKAGWPIIADFTNTPKESLADQIRTLSNLVSESYLRHESDLVVVVYSNFINTISQKATYIQLLPVPAARLVAEEVVGPKIVSFEPSPAEVLQLLLSHYLQISLRQIALDALAAEHSARMIAMKNANDNATDIIKDLSLVYNQTRQTAITNEIADIVSGSNFAS